jgi:hypothetical protein
MRWLLPLALLLFACSGTTPTDPEIPTEEPLPVLAPIPAYFEGFYVEGPHASEPPGSGHIYLMGWGDDLTQIRVPGFVSVHCCMWDYNTWKFDPSHWDRIKKEWLDPLTGRGLLMGIYLVDEPEGYGISWDEVARAHEFVSSRGYPTMAASVNQHQKRLPVDYWSAVIYSWGTKKEWARDWHRTSDSDWIVGQAFDAGPGYENGIPDQRYWRETAREVGKPIISWVWRWPGQTACANDPECVEAWR